MGQETGRFYRWFLRESTRYIFMRKRRRDSLPAAGRLTTVRSVRNDDYVKAERSAISTGNR